MVVGVYHKEFVKSVIVIVGKQKKSRGHLVLSPMENACRVATYCRGLSKASKNIQEHLEEDLIHKSNKQKTTMYNMVELVDRLVSDCFPLSAIGFPCQCD